MLSRRKGMHKEILCVVLVMLCAVPPSIGQQTREAGHVDDPSALDSAHFMVSVVREYNSIAGFYLDSDLVTQGDIKKVLPTRDVSRSIVPPEGEALTRKSVFLQGRSPMY